MKIVCEETGVCATIATLFDDLSCSNTIFVSTNFGTGNGTISIKIVVANVGYWFKRVVKSEKISLNSTNWIFSR